MLIIIFLIAALDLAFSAPAPASTTALGATIPLTIFGREVPDCVNVASCRTIQDIIWSCLVTIFACTWVAVHPNVPRPQDSGWKRLKQRVLIMVYAILAPEFIVMWALRQRIGAAEHMREYNKKFYPMVTPPSHSIWWYIKRWFNHPRDEKLDGLWTITHGFLLEMHGLVDGSGDTIRSTGDDIPYPLEISEEEISDKSKGDFFTKLVVVVQTSWFVFQCLARWISHLPVTELEVVTLAFALLNLGTYTLWWNKSQNVSVAIRMDQHRRIEDHAWERKETIGENGGNAIQGTLSEVGAEQNMDEGHHPLGLKRPLEDQPNRNIGFLGKATAAVKQYVYGSKGPIHTVTTAFHSFHLQSLTVADIVDFVMGPFTPLLAMVGVGDGNEHTYSSRYDYRSVSICFLIIGTAFGGLHLIPIWSSSFSSDSEKLLWELCAGWITVTPFLSVSLFFFEGRVFGTSGSLLDICIFGVGALYLIARLILVVLAFTTLRRLPPDAFRNIEWTTFLPHF